MYTVQKNQGSHVLPVIIIILAASCPQSLFIFLKTLSAVMEKAVPEGVFQLSTQVA